MKKERCQYEYTVQFVFRFEMQRNENENETKPKETEDTHTQRTMADAPSEKQLEELYSKLQQLTRHIGWKITTGSISWRIPNPSGDASEKYITKQITEGDWNSPVMYGTHLLSFGFALMRTISVGTDGEYTTLKDLFDAIKAECRSLATEEEIEDLQDRYSSRDKFKADFPNVNKITFADTLKPRVLFEGPITREVLEEDDLEVYAFNLLS